MKLTYFKGTAIRVQREKQRDGNGLVWVAARDVLKAVSLPHGAALSGDQIAAIVGDEACRTLLFRSPERGTYRVVFILASAAKRLLTGWSPALKPSAADQFTTFLRMEFNISMMDQAPMTTINAAALPAPAAAPSVQPEGTPEFTFKDQKVRVVMLEGEPWFAAPDVVRCFGIDAKSGTFNSLRPLAGDEKRVLRKEDATVAFPFHGSANSCAIVSESGLYKLVMRSDKPEAKAFQDWVTREVLPSIRKTGSYGVVPQAASPAPTTIPSPVLLEREFRGMVECRRDASIKRAQELRSELETLDITISKDSRLLDLLAA